MCMQACYEVMAQLSYIGGNMRYFEHLHSNPSILISLLGQWQHMENRHVRLVSDWLTRDSSPPHC